MYIYLLISIIILLVLSICFIYNNNSNNTQPYKYKTWYKPITNRIKNRLYRDVLEDNGISRILTYEEDKIWDIYVPAQSSTSKAFKDIKLNNKHQIINLVSNNGSIGSKKQIWKTLSNYYGRNKASTIMPPSYIFPQDLDIFKKNYDKNKMYMLKSEKQRQEGLKLSSNYNKIINSNKDGYIIVQEYIDNPLTYNGHKINFRIYLLIVCQGTDKSAYMYRDGIVSYAKTEVLDNKTSFNNGVASFYTSKELYDDGFPITFSELKNKVSSINWQMLEDKFRDQLTKVFNASKSVMGNYKLKYGNKTFQLFGVDFMVTNDYDTYIMEINVGPGMDPYSEKDDKMRVNLYEDLLSTVGIINETNSNNFIKL